jgi:hypothetical protein
MIGLNAHDVKNFYGGLIAIGIGILGFIFARTIAEFNFGPSLFFPKGGGDKMIKLYVIYGRIVCSIIVLLSVYMLIALLLKATN